MAESVSGGAHLRFAAIYMTSTHVALVVLAVAAPAVATVSSGHSALRTFAEGALIVSASAAGGYALFTRRRNGHRSTPWKAAVCTSGTSALALWLVAVPDGANPILSSMPFALVLSAMADVDSVRAATLRLLLGTGALLVVGSFTSQIYSDSELPALLKAALVPSLIAAAVFAQDRVFLLAAELDQLRADAAAVAVADERLRFAGDLHDIQGQYLQLMVLEAGLVAKLIGRDPDAAATRARRLQSVATRALDEMHRVVHSYREVRLGDEIENAARVLRAAGIECRIEGEHTVVPVMFESAFGILIREGVTNVLRHTRADTCRILVEQMVLSTGGTRYVVMLEDSGHPGVSAEGGGGTGLENLGDRFRRIGGGVGLEVGAGGARLTGWASSEYRGDDDV